MTKRKIIFSFLLTAALLTGASGLYAKTWRVISIAPNVTELLYAVGKGSAVIADTRQCDHPEAARTLPKIGDMGNVNMEKIVALKPDIVIASFSGNSREQVERLASLGIRVLTLKADTVNGILSNTAELGELFGTDVSFPLGVFRKKLDCVAAAPVRKKALLLVSAFPFYAVSTNTFMGDMLRIAGFNNVVRTAVGYPLLTREELAMLRPDTVILPDRYKKDGDSLKKFFQEIGVKPSFLYLNEDGMSRPGPRIFDTIIALSKFR
jgi:iron complex transport system substrate-binding protein